jgi:hypothetical protein
LIGEEVMMFWIGLFVASIVYYFIWGKKKSSVRYTPNGNAYVTDGSGYTYPGVLDEPEVKKASDTGFLDFIKFILISTIVGILAYVFFGNIKDGLWNINYVFFLGFVVIVVLIFYTGFKSSKNYLSMLTAGEYTKNYPSCKTAHGYSCCNCGSRSIRNWGVDSATDTKRVFICNHCNAHLL